MNDRIDTHETPTDVLADEYPSPGDVYYPRVLDGFPTADLIHIARIADELATDALADGEGYPRVYHRELGFEARAEARHRLRVGRD